MARPRRFEVRILLTAAELELMQVLWRAPGTVQEVLDGLSGPPRAYTTVATLLKILEDKGFAKSEREGRSFVYSAAVPRDRYEATAVNDVVTRVFSGDATALVRTLVADDRLTDEDLATLRKLLGGGP
jgi:predicted transcriptional regulator